MANIVPHSLEQPKKIESLPPNSAARLNSTNLSLPERFINLLMVDGKKNIATQIFCSAGHEFLRALVEKPAASGGVQPLLIICLRIAVRNVQPNLECRRCRVAGTSPQVPASVSE